MSDDLLAFVHAFDMTIHVGQPVTDGVAEIDACYTLETEKGHRALLHNRGLRWGAPHVLSRLAQGS